MSKNQQGSPIASLKSLRDGNLKAAIAHRLRHCRMANPLRDIPAEVCGIMAGGMADTLLSIPPRYKWRLHQYPEGWQQRGVDFLADDECWCLFMHGNVGTRKTSFAVALLVAWQWTMPWKPREPCFVRAAKGHFLPPDEVAGAFRDFKVGHEAIAEWQRADMVVLDDLGATRSTPHITEQLLYLLEARYDWRLKTIITSNLNLDQLAEYLNRRVSSRLQEGMLLDLGETDSRVVG